MRMAVAVVCIALVLACSTEENSRIENTDDNDGSLINIENLEEQVSESNIPELNDDLAGDLSRLPAEVFPACMFRPLPEYPDSARDNGIEGDVLVGLYLDSIGTIMEVKITRSSGSDLLDQVAIEAAWNSLWTPAQRNGEGISVWTTVSYKFELD